MNDERPADEELVSAAKSAPDGDMKAFNELVRIHRGRVLANCRFISRSPNDAEDLAQEVFVKAYFALPRFEGRSTFKTWIQRIKINHCLNFLDKRRGKEWLNVEDPSLMHHEALQFESRAERLTIAMSERARIERILDELNETLRVPLVLRDSDGCSYQEIAEQLGISLSAVKMRIKRAREQFRELWEQQEAGAA